MKTEMLVPRVNTNDDELEVLQWWVEDKEFVKKGQDIVDLESSKAAIAVESETSGYILKHCQTGDTINVGTALATFYSDLSELESDLVNDGNSQANQTLPVISQKSTTDASKTVDSLVFEECDRPSEVAPVSAESLQEQTDIHNLCEQVPPAAIPSLPYIEQQKFRELELKENKGTLNCTRFSKSAREYINRHNIDTSRFEGMGLVTVTLRPKIFGTWVLSQLVKNKPNSAFISFAAANSFFGVATLGAYAAGNSFIDSFSHYLRYQYSMQSYCFTWSMWDELGMSRGYHLKELSRSLGYYAIAPMQGIYSMLAGLLYDQGQLLIGLDGSKHYIRRYTETKSYGVQKLCAYFSAVTECVNRAELQEFEVRDRFGTKSSCDFIQLQEMPLLPDGTVNRSLLMKVEDIKPQQPQFSVIPQTEVEKTIASIWQEVLSLDGIGIYDNFFDIGGSSLLLVQANNKLREALKREILIKERILCDRFGKN